MEDSDKRKKSKIPIKPKAAVRWLLENATGSQLDYMNRLAKGGDFKDFINLITKFKDYNVYTVFEYKAQNEADLFEYRAYRKGGVDTLTDFLLACQAATDEIHRRKQKP